ncbi:MAG TPA: type II toxin-antitoxin system VapC family toxin [Roseiarcus sp.]|nr:type II toxin-antitoxin system VapC family toxin [Roseiarcus sp.]
MLAIDTNVIVRFLVDDDHEQFRRARQAIANSPVFVSSTVLLECEWVLRSAYGYKASDIVEALRAFAGLENVTLEDPELAATALDWRERGMDFADALHLAGSERCEAFVTFDRRLAEAAAAVGAIPVRAP